MVPGLAEVTQKKSVSVYTCYVEQEALAIFEKFTEETGITDLSEYTLYSSCEPCFMCCGACVWTKLGRLVYAASDVELCALLGVQGSACSEMVFSNSGAQIEVASGVLREEALQILAAYFKDHKKG